MLVLSREEHESIMIGDDIKITVIQIRSSKAVKIGIEAPANVPIHRVEVYEAIQRDKRERGTK